MSPLQPMFADAHERSQLAIQRIRNPQLASVRENLRSACACIYKAAMDGHIPDIDAFRALTSLGIVAEHVETASAQ